MWIGLLIGLVIGWWIGGIPGALVLGFLGWLVGLVVDSRRAQRTSPPPRIVEPAGDRLARLERTVASLDARLARLEKGTGDISGLSPAATPAPTPAAATEVEPEPISAPSPAATPAPAAAAAPAEAVREIPVAKPPTPNPLVAWITGGNAIARVGLLVLFFGLAFLLKYAADRDLVPVAARVGGVAAVGVLLLAGGWRLRERRPGFALGLQGAGIAVLYLTSFAALRIYHLLPASAVLAILAALAVLSAVIAVRQDSALLAAFGAGGGFLAPILASPGGDSHVTLFTYYLLLNAGIVAIALFKAWRGLNVMGFLFTFFIGFWWGWSYYRPEYFASTEPFLVAFFAMYVAVAVLFARREASGGSRGLDATLVFGVPIAAFGLQAGLVRNMENGAAISSAALAAFYLVLAAAVRRMRGAGISLSAAFAGLGIGFATLAVPLAFDARWTAAAWSVEGAVIVAFGLRQGRGLVRALGLLLQAAAALAYLAVLPRATAQVPLVDAAFVGGVLLAGAGIWTARLIDDARDRLGAGERQLAGLALGWGIAWWLFAALREIDAFVARDLRLTAAIGMLAGTALAASVLSMALRWRRGAWPALALLPALALCLVFGTSRQTHPFENDGYIAWIAALAVQAWVLRRHAPEAGTGYAKVLHGGSALLVAALGAFELQWISYQYGWAGTAWVVAGTIAAPALVSLVIALRAMDTRWPVAANPIAYRTGALVPMFAYMAFWVLYANWTSDGSSDPWPYYPIANALDLAHLLVLAAVVAAWRGHARRAPGFPAGLEAGWVVTLAAALGFLWLNGILLRSIHHWADIPYRFDPMMRSVIVQASLSVFWTAIAVALMLVAARLVRRRPWIAGASLLAVVVVKLFLLDLSHVSGVERIVSFIAVGLLMVAIGYFVPVPPKRGQEAP
ncbi:MAG TPA: DUF2339 domain-containing protein [Usitatibacter sp.]|nr:DUF2339 domain-containing protein [Usitatibacter sp.]